MLEVKLNNFHIGLLNRLCLTESSRLKEEKTTGKEDDK
jgi:hypothetical protein